MMKMKMLVVMITMTMMRMKILVVVFGADPAEWADPTEWADPAEWVMIQPCVTCGVYILFVFVHRHETITCMLPLPGPQCSMLTATGLIQPIIRPPTRQRFILLLRAL